MSTPRLALLALPLLLAACDTPFDTVNRPGAWRPQAANETNLRVMIDRPEDLSEGRGAEGAQGQTAAAAVDRLRSDRVRPLPDVVSAPAISQVGGGAR